MCKHNNITIMKKGLACLDCPKIWHNEGINEIGSIVFSFKAKYQRRKKEKAAKITMTYNENEWIDKLVEKWAEPQ